jgi:hypothetical protein
VHLYGGEPLHNIIINDLDINGLELLEYRYDTPMYLYREPSNKYYANVTLDGDKECNIIVNGTEYAYIDANNNLYINNAAVEGVTKQKITLKHLRTEDLEMLVNPMTGSSTPNLIKFDNLNSWYVAKISYGETAGYRFTDLTYPGDLIGSAGESLTSILDKIKNMLGDFEYFYDLDG